MKTKILSLIIILILVKICFGDNLIPIPWAYQLQEININQIVENSTFEIMVMDYSSDGTDQGKFSWEQIDSIHVSGKYAISYISIGEAESYRFYWDSTWVNNPPVWLGPENPDWEGNYKVRFWYSEWQNIVFTYIDTIISQGFDGIYMDIIDAYYYWMEEAPEQPYADSLMIDFVHNIRNHVDNIIGKNEFYLIPQNGEQIIEEINVSENLREQYLNDIAGIGVEDVFFVGDEDNNNPFTPQQYRIDVLAEFLDNGIPVFSVEYLTIDSLIATYMDTANSCNYIPYVTVRDLNILNDGIFFSIENNEHQSLKSFTLFQNFPNPFSPRFNRESTTISFLATKNTKNTNINIYNVKGQLVKQLKIQSPIKLGTKLKINEIEWDGRDEKGNPLSSGIYFYTLEIDNKIIDIKKCLLLR